MFLEINAQDEAEKRAPIEYWAHSNHNYSRKLFNEFVFPKEMLPNESAKKMHKLLNEHTRTHCMEFRT